MLKIIIPAQEDFDESKMEFINFPSRTITLEHSLVSLSKWEAKYKKPFLDEDNNKTPEETLDYIKMMTITQNVPDSVYKHLTADNINEIKDYIQDKHSATWFKENKENNQPQSRKQILTAELIYGYMVVLQIPWEAQKWHINQLLILIRVVNELNKPKDNKKSNPSKTAKNYKAMNAERLKRLGTPG